MRAHRPHIAPKRKEGQTMLPDAPSNPLHRAMDRLDAVCREINAPLAGALPALVLAGVLVFGSPALPDGSAAAAQGCDPSRAADLQVSVGPRSQDLLCMGNSLKEAARANAGSEGGR